MSQGCGCAGYGAADMSALRPAIAKGTYPGEPDKMVEATQAGTLNGAAPRGFTRSTYAAYSRCMVDSLPPVPAGTLGEQTAFMAPFRSYCTQWAASNPVPQATLQAPGYAPGRVGDGPPEYVGTTFRKSAQYLIVAGATGAAVLLAYVLLRERS